MKSRWILNLSLALLIAALAAFVYFKPAIDKPAGTPLTALDASAVTRVRIEKTAEPITLERTPNGWRLQTPVRARANRFNVDNLLRITTATSGFQTPVNAAALATYGLDKPTLRLLLNDEEILVGAMHPMRQQHYVRYRDTIHLVDSHVLATALFNYSSFIDTQLIEESRKLTALRLPGLRLELKDGVWRREPYDPKISMDRLNDFVAHWQNARALSVEKLSSAPALAQIELMFDNGGKPVPLKLVVLAYKPEFILARRDEGLEYQFPEEIGSRLLKLETGEQ
jgi:hypothetical protein